MNVGIVGLGLIGGSFAKAYKSAGAHTVYGFDTDRKMLDFALLDGAVDERLDFRNIQSCELLLLCVYPDAAIAYLQEAAPHLSPETLVIDCCGTKRKVCKTCFLIAQRYGFTFIGGHPMAGTQYSGFKYSKAGLFKGAYMILVPPVYDDMELLDTVKTALSPAGFGHYSVTSAEKHDQIIAFTSQLAHIVSNAYVKSPSAKAHKGFSAGSYKDLTRVAWLNETMWSELCMENKENVIFELETLLRELEKYKTALEKDDLPALQALFAEGKKRKSEIDG
ncbi:MAG: prephenate dehydrogenase [Clostridia bacterium]